MELKGANGILILIDKFIHIQRSGITGLVLFPKKKDRDIKLNINEIKDIKFKRGFLLISGYIYFVLENNSKNITLPEACKNKYAIVFRTNKRQQAYKIYNAVKKYI